MWGKESGEKSSICFSPCTLVSESASWFIKACYGPFYFPLEKQTISIQLHLLGEQKQKEPEFWWSGGFLLFCGVFFTTGNTKYTEEGDVTKPVLSYSNSVHLVSGITLTYCRWSIHLSLSPVLFLSASREVESKHWKQHTRPKKLKWQTTLWKENAPIFNNAKTMCQKGKRKTEDIPIKLGKVSS